MSYKLTINGYSPKVTIGGVDYEVSKVIHTKGGITTGYDICNFEPQDWITFSAERQFTVSHANRQDGKLYYSLDAKTWSYWGGTPVTSTIIYVSGSGNSTFNPDGSYNCEPFFNISGIDVKCRGNIEYLRGYETDDYPEMADFCYSYMFYGCEALIAAPVLPAATLTASCYEGMFENCLFLTAPPELPATTLADYCYQSMFSGCHNLVVNTRSSDGYARKWRIPAGHADAEISGTSGLCGDMLNGTGGSKTTDPAIETTYYIETSALEYATWEEIESASADGYASELWAVGDEKTVALKDGTEVIFQIVGFDHDDLVDGGKAGITFCMKEVLNSTFVGEWFYVSMNPTDTNVGGWADSDIRTYWMSVIEEQLFPDELSQVIKKVMKKTTEGGGTDDAPAYDICETRDRLFLFSKVEVDGLTTSILDRPYAGEGTQYEYWKFRPQQARIKWLYQIDEAYLDHAASWWLRSPQVNREGYFRNVRDVDGFVYFTPASGAKSTYLCLGFCI